MFLPSGEYAGLASAAAAVVSRRTSVEPTTVMYRFCVATLASARCVGIAKGHPTRPGQANTTSSPFGEKAG
jgi:hypothetical protein